MRLLTLALLPVLLVLPGSNSPAAAETPYPQLYFRNVRTPAEAIEVLDGRSRVRNADGLLVVLDLATFSAPPFRQEFRPFAPGVEVWLDELEAWADRRAERGGPGAGASRGSAAAPPGAGPIFVAATVSRTPVEVGSPRWRSRVAFDLGRKWWREDAFRFEPATRWMTRLLRDVPGRRRMLTLITSEILPERWADCSHGRQPGDEPWRRKLLPIGGYWDEEAIGKKLEQADVVLDVVAPEARFCDFLPITEIPELPWASRPEVRLHPDAVALWEKFKEWLEQSESSPENRAIMERFNQAVHFHSRLPYDINARFGSYQFFNTDSPSALGYWPFVRAAARTGGSYVFYPFPPVNFRDACPYDPALLRALAPATGSREEIAQSKAGDAALKALLRAQRLVFHKTEWLGSPSRATGWSGYASTQPLAREPRFRERDKPRDLVPPVTRSADMVERRGAKIAAVVPLYDEAVRLLAETEKKIEAGEIPTPHRRSMANLRLGRFWFEMSAFHLKALSLYCREIREHMAVAKGMGVTVEDLSIRAAPAFRMSDCLRGYEGHSVPVQRDRALQAGEGIQMAGGATGPRMPDQSNFLPRYPGTEYRALRHPAEVFKRLDPRLLDRALRVVEAGRSVMSHEGRSPWGFMVYYAEVHTFVLVWDGGKTVRGPQEPRPGKDPAETPVPEPTPRPVPTKPTGPSSGNK